MAATALYASLPSDASSLPRRALKGLALFLGLPESEQDATLAFMEDLKTPAHEHGQLQVLNVFFSLSRDHRALMFSMLLLLQAAAGSTPTPRHTPKRPRAQLRLAAQSAEARERPRG
jgi:hypothetical protein